MQKKLGLILFLVFYLTSHPLAFAEGTIIYDTSLDTRAELLKKYDYSFDTANSKVKQVLYNESDTASSAAQSRNTVIVKVSDGSDTDPFCVFGGMLNETSIGCVEWNNVLIYDNVIIPYYISGGDAIGSISRYNTVEIFGGTLKEVYGGSLWGSTDTNEIYGNKVIIHNGTVGIQTAYDFTIQIGDSAVYGGQIYNSFNKNDSVYDNHVIVEGNTQVNAIFGGQINNIDNSVKDDYQGKVNKNTITVGGNAVVGVDSKNIVAKSLAGGWNLYGYVENNAVLIKDNAEINTDTHGGFLMNEGKADGNRVTILNNAKFGTGVDIYGGRAYSNESASSMSYNTSADKNIVIINGDGIRIHGYIYGGSVGSAKTLFSASEISTANNNIVSIGGAAEIVGSVYGGYNAYFNAQNNLVEIRDSATIENGSIYGGYVFGAANTTGANDQATYNTVTIAGNPNIETMKLFGGYIENLGIGSDAFTGNTLNVQPSMATGIAVKSVQNFEFYNFQIPQHIRNGDALLYVTDTAALADSTESLAQVTLAASGLPRLQLYERFHLLLSENSLLGTIKNADEVVSAESRFLRYSFLLTQEDKSIDALLNHIEVRPQGKAVAEPFAATLVFLNQNSDLLIDYGISAAERFGLQSRNYGWRPFAYFRGATDRVETGSSADVDGFHVMAGLSRQFCWAMQPVLLGGFVEYGLGDYSTFNSFADNAIHNSGNTHYLGGGMFTRIRGNEGYYMEGSVHVGSVQTNFWMKFSDDPQPLTCDTKVAYFSSHAGFGRLLHWDNNLTHLDLSAKYLWTRMNRHTLYADDLPFQFRGTDSNRLRVGSRLSYDYPDQIWSTYAGLAYEYELDGSVRSTVSGMNVGAPQLRGGTGIGELGVIYSPFDCLSVNFAVQGYTGQRNGGNLSLTTNWRF
ncbi:MAG: hypothetical protein LBJ67_13935 [Planctomycetaceae bacterium]|jgi:hypothetical protein|nr:hypothetical protein [Planctomycetaceae bacterium]